MPGKVPAAGNTERRKEIPPALLEHTLQMSLLSGQPRACKQSSESQERLPRSLPERQAGVHRGDCGFFQERRRQGGQAGEVGRAHILMSDQVKDVGLLPRSHQQESTFKKGWTITFCLES